jgi:glycosyltransferase involved in cell wall biosynthesis
MRIIQVVPSIASLSSGPTYTVTRLSEQLRDMGHEVEIACVDRQGHRLTPPWVHRFPQVRLSGKLMMSRELRRWLAACAISEPKPVIHNNSLWQLPNLYSGWVSARFGLPYIVSPHGTLGRAAFAMGSRLKPLWWRYLQEPALAPVTCFHATARSEAAEIRALGFKQPIAIVPNGIDIPADTGSEGGRSREVLYLGRIHPKKGVDRLLRAWKCVQQRFPSWHLRIVGPDTSEYACQMKALASQLNLDRVTFAGELLGQQRSCAYRRAALFVLPTLNENFGVAVAEALAHETPALVTKGAPWSGLERWDCGWWIDCGDDALAACLVTAMSTDAARLSRMGARGRRWMQSEYSWGTISKQMESVYAWAHAGAFVSEVPAEVEVSLLGVDRLGTACC